MDRYPPPKGSAFHHPPDGGGHGAKRQWQPGKRCNRQEPRSFLSDARAGAR